MKDWIAIVIAGAAGGLFSTFLPTGTRNPRQSTTEVEPTSNKGLPFVGRLALYTVGGAAAAFVLWAGYTSDTDFSATAIAPRDVATAFVIGGAGLAIISRLFAEAANAKTWKSIASLLVEAGHRSRSTKAQPSQDTLDSLRNAVDTDNTALAQDTAEKLVKEVASTS